MSNVYKHLQHCNKLATIKYLELFCDMHLDSKHSLHTCIININDARTVCTVHICNRYMHSIYTFCTCTRCAHAMNAFNTHGRRMHNLCSINVIAVHMPFRCALHAHRMWVVPNTCDTAGLQVCPMSIGSLQRAAVKALGQYCGRFAPCVHSI